MKEIVQVVCSSGQYFKVKYFNSSIPSQTDEVKYMNGDFDKVLVEIVFSLR